MQIIAWFRNYSNYFDHIFVDHTPWFGMAVRYVRWHITSSVNKNIISIYWVDLDVLEIESINTTSMEDASTRVLEKNKEYLRR